jgi:transcriptional regulator with XRE-family HTH domain
MLLGFSNTIDSRSHDRLLRLFYNYCVQSSIFIVQSGTIIEGEGKTIMEEIAPNVGSRIRTMREQRGFSLRALAERCNLSINAISLIERGENSPTVSSLHRLATALGVKITDFFEDPHEHAMVYVKHDQRLATQGNGLLMESLGIGLRNQQLEPFMVTSEPGIGEDSESIVHPGQEFVYCLERTVLYQVSESISSGARRQLVIRCYSTPLFPQYWGFSSRALC